MNNFMQNIQNQINNIFSTQVGIKIVSRKQQPLQKMNQP